MNELLINLVTIFFTAVIIPLITIATKALINYLNTKIKNEKAAKLMIDIISVIENSVKMVSQTYVDCLKKEGSFDKAAQEKALEIAFNTAKNLFSEEAKQYLHETYINMDEWLKIAIESMINNQKI